ncbi:hypothetical protein [Treponema sp.]|uniref:hypothetical protein n=1 Tax=Treponema sp. TaxID=166 RepID=UPI003F028560
MESEGFSTGVVTCPLSSSEPPLEPSEQEGNVNARLRARIKAVATRGGVVEWKLIFILSP